MARQLSWQSVNNGEDTSDFILADNQENSQTVVIYDSDDEINWQGSSDSDYIETDSEDTDCESDNSTESGKQKVSKTKSNKDTGEWKCSGSFKTFSFEADPGFKCTNIGPDPYHYFELLFDKSFFSNIVMETNNYGISRKDNWKQVTVAEFKVFLGLLLHTGTIKCPQIQNYWSVHRMFNFPCFSRHMSRNRFKEILLSLHFCPNNRNNNYLNKISPIIDYFNDKMKQVYYPHKELSIDQTMIPWLGTLVFRPYSPGKRRKFGIKLYVLSEGSGIALRIEIYKGYIHEFSEKGHPTKVVLNLLTDFLQKGHSVYLNNFYTSYELSKQLLDAKTYCTGILRKSIKENNKNFINAKLLRGVAISCHKNNVMMGKFRGKEYILFMSSEFKPHFVELRNEKTLKHRMPLPVYKYNSFMNGMKKKDEMLSSFTCIRKAFKWYIKLWLNIVETLLLNAFLLYSTYSTSTKKLSFCNFRLNIIDTLICTNKQENLQSTFLLTEHLPEMLPRSESNRIKRKRCRQCYVRGSRTNSNYFCPGCQDKPGLCLGECFKEYHKRIL